MYESGPSSTDHYYGVSINESRRERAVLRPRKFTLPYSRDRRLTIHLLACSIRNCALAARLTQPQTAAISVQQKILPRISCRKPGHVVNIFRLLGCRS